MSQNNEIISKVINVAPALMSYWGRDLRCRFANASYETWFGKSPQEMVGISLEKFLGSAYESSLPYMLGAFEGTTQVFELELVRPDGFNRRALVSYYPDIVDGVVVGCSVHAVDITRTKQLEFELHKSQQRIELLASRDFLTGLPNRFLLTDRISALISQAEESGELLGLVSMNIDGFRKVNELYGPDEGDAILREVARRIKGEVGDAQTVVRMNGDEFLFLIAGIHSVVDLNLVIARVLKTVQQPLQYFQASFIPRLSWGSAVYPLDATNVPELLGLADRALHVKRRDSGHSSADSQSR